MKSTKEFSNFCSSCHDDRMQLHRGPTDVLVVRNYLVNRTKRQQRTRLHLIPIHNLLVIVGLKFNKQPTVPQKEVDEISRPHFKTYSLYVSVHLESTFLATPNDSTVKKELSVTLEYQ